MYTASGILLPEFKFTSQQVEELSSSQQFAQSDIHLNPQHPCTHFP
jgi:hypothetical protein